MSHGAVDPRRPVGHDLGWTLCLLLAVLLWEFSGLDLSVAQLFGTPEGFPWRDHGVLRDWLHEGGRNTAWLALAAWLGWVLMPGRRPDERRRHLAWIVAALLAALGISLLKRFSLTSCPWDLGLFGGTATYVPHWQWARADGGPGRCFPSGHASAGFALMALYFALRPTRPPQARAALAVSVTASVIFGAVQVARGAHYPSHAMWTGLICWTAFVSLDAAWEGAARRRRLPGQPVSTRS